MQASLIQFLPTPLLTPDQGELLRSDNVVSSDAVTQRRTLAGLVIVPKTNKTNKPKKHRRNHKTGQFRTQPTQ